MVLSKMLRSSFQEKISLFFLNENNVFWKQVFETYFTFWKKTVSELTLEIQENSKILETIGRI